MIFSADRADHVEQVFNNVLKHTKGAYARKDFQLAPWQSEILRPLFGNLRYDEQYSDWVRQYRIAWLELGRGNGKSEILAGIALYLLLFDGEEGAEVYGAAKDREQASLVFRVAKRMVELSPGLSQHLKPLDSRKRIICPATDSFYQVIAADAAGNLGENPHGIIFDEVIAQPNRELWDALKTGMGKRRQPLMIAATTAGNDQNSFAASEHEYCKRVIAEPSLDPARFVYMRNAPDDADWLDEKVWGYANPALGDFLSIEALRDEAREAAANPAAENTFRQFRLNQWVQQVTRWLSLASWDASGAQILDESSLKGKRAFGGLDLASSTDIAALCWDFPSDGHDVLWRFWIPQARLQDLDRRTAGRASVWVRQGLITATPGDVIDYKAILAQIDRDLRTFDVPRSGGLAYDRWGMTQLSQDLQDLAGREDFLYAMGQGFKDMSPPIKELERLILLKSYRHGGNPVMRWMVGNLVVQQDAAGNIKFAKDKAADKIDGAVAAVMALACADRGAAKQPATLVTF